MSRTRLQLAVVGAGACDQRTSERALAVGREIARAGAVLLCGGGDGVMAAAAAGARAEGGRTVGLMPGASASESPPNPGIEIAVYSGMGQARNLLVVLSASAVVAVAGGWGTLSEIALAVKHGIPVVLLDSWRLNPPDGGPAPLLSTAETPEEAVALALAAARRHRQEAAS